MHTFLLVTEKPDFTTATDAQVRAYLLYRKAVINEAIPRLSMAAMIHINKVMARRNRPITPGGRRARIIKKK